MLYRSQKSSRTILMLGFYTQVALNIFLDPWESLDRLHGFAGWAGQWDNFLLPIPLGWPVG
jgi:hypothetical protein